MLIVPCRDYMNGPALKFHSYEPLKYSGVQVSLWYEKPLH